MPGTSQGIGSTLPHNEDISFVIDARSIASGLRGYITASCTDAEVISRLVLFAPVRTMGHSPHLPPHSQNPQTRVTCVDAC